MGTQVPPGLSAPWSWATSHQHCSWRQPLPGVGREREVPKVGHLWSQFSLFPALAHHHLGLGWMLWRSPQALQPEGTRSCTPGNGISWLMSARLAHVRLARQQLRVCAPRPPVSIDTPRLSSLLEQLLALPQELVWILFSPPVLIRSRCYRMGPLLGARAALWAEWCQPGLGSGSRLCGAFQVPDNSAPHLLLPYLAVLISPVE